jgi:class 3 adenylate cyclase/tetratricopeptide (TPR) repeat protein
MPVTCPSCGAEAPDDARFCPSCGAALAPVSGRERKFATALFADLVGSTDLGEREDPEVVQELVGRVFDRLVPVIERYGGVVDNYMGDAILAIFGVPHVHEDDPERAVRAGLEMQDVLSELNRSFANEGRSRLLMRIGLESGEVLVDPARPDRRITGDTVNVASRLQTAASPGDVVAGPSVHASTHRVIDYEGLPALELKGKAELVPAWRAVRVAARIRGERRPSDLKAQLVGREEEVAMLRQGFQRVVREGRPALVTILGPAGTGKSRLVREFFSYIDSLEQVVFWREGRCLAYGNTSYSALADSIKAHCELLEDDASGQLRAKVERAVADLFGGEGPLDEVLALVGGGAETEMVREQLFDGWRRFLEKMAQRHPLVLVWEDIHWADAGLLDFIEHAADWAQGPIMILTLARPELLEVRPTWGGGRRNYTAVYLDPLTPAENRNLLDDLAGGVLPDSLASQIVEHAEGNPLYTEEIVQMLIDRGTLQRSDGALHLTGEIDSVDVPRSVQSLIAGRIDGLGSEEKATLQNAAVIGRTAWTGAVSALGGLPAEEARRLMGALRVRDLLVPSEPSAFSGEQEFWFRHVLIKDIAYESIPKRERAHKHRAAAEWAEQRSGDRAEEQAELIATHYEHSQRYLTELGAEPAETAEIRSRLHTWSVRAGRRAESLWQPERATHWYRVAIGAASPEVEGLELARLWEAYARVGAGIEPVDEVIAALETALNTYEALHLDVDAGRIETKLGFMVWQSGDDDGGRAWLDKSVSRLAETAAGSELANALQVRGNFGWRHNQGKEAEADLRRAVELAEEAGAEVTAIEARHDLGLSLSWQGRMEEAMSLIEASFEAAQQGSDLNLRLRTATNWGAVLSTYGSDFRKSAEITRIGLEESRRAGNHGHATWQANNLAGLLRRLGDLGEAEEYQEIALQAAEAIDVPTQRGWSLKGLAEINLWRGDVAEARRFWDSTGRRLEDQEPQSIPEYGRLLIELNRAEGRPEEAVTVTRQILEIFDSIGPFTEINEFALEAVRALVAAGHREDAAQVRSLMKGGGFDPPRAVDAYRMVIDGLLATEFPEKADHLKSSVEIFAGLGLRIPQIRALIDLADAIAEAEEDPTEVLEEARSIAASCGAGLYLDQIEERERAVAESS